jgi:hypothetical protein
MSARIRSAPLLKAQFEAWMLSLLHHDISGIDEQMRRGRLDAGEMLSRRSIPLAGQGGPKKPPGPDRALPAPRLLRDGGRA